MIRAILFDAFRTLFDTFSTHERAARKIVENHGLSVDPDAFHDKWDEFILEGWRADGLDGRFILLWPMFEKCLKRTFEFFGVQEYNAKTGIQEWLDLVASAPLFPETRTVIETLSHDYKIAIVSNTDNFEIGMCMKNHPLPVPHVITSEDSRCYKPNRKIFDDALAAVGVSADEAVVVGDSQTADVLGAHNAGIRSIWINRNRKAPKPDLPLPDAELPDLTGIPEVLKRFNTQ